MNENGKRILGLNPNVFYTGITSFLTDTTSKMIYAVMPLFLLSLGATKTELSLIEGIAESTASVLKALSGRKDPGEKASAFIRPWITAARSWGRCSHSGSWPFSRENTVRSF